jgi:hypothetical protein
LLSYDRSNELRENLNVEEKEKEMTKKAKWLVVFAVVGLLVVAFAGTALAAGPLGSNVANANCTGTCPGPGGGDPRVGGIFNDDVVTKLLGLTPEQIQEQRQAGKSLVQIAATKNISEDALINAIMADRKADLQKLVDAKTLTQDQANQRLDFMKTQIKTMVERTTVGPPATRGMMGGAGGFGGGMMGRGWR